MTCSFHCRDLVRYLVPAAKDIGPDVHDLRFWTTET